MIEIPLTQGQIALVADVDGDLAELKWLARFDPDYADGGKYIAIRRNKKATEYMHRTILSRILDCTLNSRELVDHEDRNPLNNQRYNLRRATSQQNNQNSSLRKDNLSGFKGVHLHKKPSIWRSSIRVFE